MAIEIISDTIEGDLTEDERGYTQTRTFRVVGLDAIPGHSRMYVASTMVGVPLRGEAHPLLGGLLGLVCVSRRAVLVDVDKVDVVCQYAVPSVQQVVPTPDGPPQIEGGSVVERVATERDRDGNPITVTYIVRDEATQVSTPDTQTGEVEFFLPMRTRKLTRLELGGISGISVLENKARTFVGTTNSTPWGGDAAGVWLCFGITFSSSDGGATYSVTYLFQANDRIHGWFSVAAYRDRSSGQIPGDADFGSDPGGLALVRVYPETDFNLLGV